MQFNVLLIFSCFVIPFARTSSETTCGCASCTNTVIISPGGEFQIYNSVPCSAGRAAAVAQLQVQSTDQSVFQVRTRDYPSSPEYYPSASTTSDTTCFNMEDGIAVGVRRPQIYVIIQCKEWSQSCHIRYNFILGCKQIEPTSSIAPTSVSTTKPVSPSTVTSIVIDNICECECCKGSATCTPVYVGVVFYGTNRCQPVDCSRQCERQFSACPVSGVEFGKIVTQCRNHANMRLKRSLYVLFLTTVLLYTFNYWCLN